MKNWISKKRLYFYLLFIIIIVFIFGMSIGSLIQQVKEFELLQTHEYAPYLDSYTYKYTYYSIEQENVLETILEPIQEWLDFEGTAYDACIPCCEKNDGITASGIKAIEGITIAADWNVLPKGTNVEIIVINEFGNEVNIGKRIVQDIGGVIKGNKIDIYFSSHFDALNFGVKNLKVRILK